MAKAPPHERTASVLLKENPILRHASLIGIERLAAESTVKNYEKGAVVAQAQIRQTHILVLALGRIVLHRRNKETKNQLLVGSIAAPAIFGDAEAYAPNNVWLVSARAVMPTTIVTIPNRAYDTFIDTEGTVAAQLYRDACARHYLAVSIMQVHGLQKTQNKILRLLRKNRTEPDSGGLLYVRPVVTELAAALGINRKTVARNLADLEAQGLLQKKNGRYSISAQASAFPSLTGGQGALWET